MPKRPDTMWDKIDADLHAILKKRREILEKSGFNSSQLEISYRVHVAINTLYGYLTVPPTIVGRLTYDAAREHFDLLHAFIGTPPKEFYGGWLDKLHQTALTWLVQVGLLINDNDDGDTDFGDWNPNYKGILYPDLTEMKPE